MNYVVLFIKFIFVLLVLPVGFLVSFIGVSVMNTISDMGGPGGFAPPKVIAGPIFSIIGLCIIFVSTKIIKVQFKYFFFFFSFVSFFILSYNLWFYPPYDGAYYILKKQWGVFPSSITEHFVSFTFISVCLFFSIFQLYKSKFRLTSSHVTCESATLLCIGFLLYVLCTYVVFISNATFMELIIYGRAWSWKNTAICVAPLVIMLSGAIAFFRGHQYLGLTLLLPSCIVSWMCLIFYLVGL